MDVIVLKGGRSTPGVIKIGDIVFRPHKKENNYTNDFLNYLEVCDYQYSQRYLGTNEKGQDMYKYIDGYVPKEIGNTTPEQLYQFMHIVKNFHDLSNGFTKSDKVICHNDLSPCNTVFIDDKPVAIIDWDSSALGERWEDICYILWLWINIGSHRRNRINILQQMKNALTAYGADESITKCFADKLLRRMNKVIIEMSPDNYQYDRTKRWVNYSKKWVIENYDIISKEIG